jgi:hypothetical protein
MQFPVFFIRSGSFKPWIVEPGIDIDNSGNTSLGKGIIVAPDGIASFLTVNDIQPDGKAVGNTGIDSLDSGNESRYCGNDFPYGGIESRYCGNDFSNCGNAS